MESSFIAFSAAFALPTDDFQLLVLEFVRGNEELLQLFLDRLRKITHVMKSVFGVELSGHCDRFARNDRKAYTKAVN
jgi:hypothetical protein